MKFTALWLSVIWVLSACQGISSQVELVAPSSSDQPGQVQPAGVDNNNEIAPSFGKYKNQKLNKFPLISSGYASTRNQGYSPVPFKKAEKPELKPINVGEKQAQPISTQQTKTADPAKVEQKPPQPIAVNQPQAKPAAIGQQIAQPININQLQAQPITKRPFDTSFYKPTTYAPKIPLALASSTTRPVAPTPTPAAPSATPEFNFEIKVTPKPFWTGNGESKPPPAVAGEVLDEVPDIIYDYDDERNQGEGVLFLVNQPQPQSVAPLAKNPPPAAPTKAPVVEGHVFNSAPFQQPPAAGFKFPPQRDPTPPPKPGKPTFRFPDPNPLPVISSRQDLPNVLPHFRPNANPPPEFTETLTAAQQGQPLWLGKEQQQQRQDVWPLREGVARPVVREPQRSPLGQLSQKVAGLFGRKTGPQQRISSRQGEVDPSDERSRYQGVPRPSAVDLRRREHPYLVVGPQHGPPPQVAGAKLIHTALASQPHQPQRRQTPPLRQPPPPPPPQQTPLEAERAPLNNRVVPVPVRIPLNPTKDVAVPQLFDPKLSATVKLPQKTVRPIQDPSLELNAALPLIKTGSRPLPAAPKVAALPSAAPPVIKPSTLVGFTAPQEAPDGNQVSVVHPAYIVKYSEKPEPPRLVNLDAPFFPSVAGPSETDTYPSGSFNWYVVSNDKSTGRDSAGAGSEPQPVTVNDIKNRVPVLESGFTPFVPLLQT